MIKFNSSPEPTIGVELELQLVEKNNLNVRDMYLHEFVVQIKLLKIHILLINLLTPKKSSTLKNIGK